MKKSHKRIVVKLVFALTLSLISSYFLVLSPKYIGDAVDLMIGKDNVDLQAVIEILKKTSILFVMYFLMTWLVSYISNNIAITFVRDLRNDLQRRINRASLSYLDTHPHGNILNLFSVDSELLTDGIFQFLSQLTSGIFVVIISFIFMWRVNPWMSLLVLAMVPIMYFTSRSIAKRSLNLYRQQQRLSGDLSTHISESMINHELILSNNYQKESEHSFELIHKEYNKVGERAQILGALVNPTVRVGNNFTFALVGLLGGYMSLNQGLSVGALTAFISYSVLFSKPFNEFSAIISQIMSAKASYERISKALDIPLDIDEGIDVDLQGNEIVFNNVDFSYKEGKKIIKDLSLNIPPLSKVAIVGPTGAGKSTLINILMRFYDVDSGSINIDGQNTRNISKKSLRSIMSIVLQDPWLFEGTIKENIKYGNPLASDEEMIEASKQAGCYDYIMSLDNRFDTVIDSGSTNMSTGQKQMVTIARAILVDSPIIILDEATSNVDILTEYKIQEVFRNIMSSRTSFFVAHRLSTVVDSHIILVMKDGKLVEQGTHEELMKLEGFYHELFLSQFTN